MGFGSILGKILTAPVRVVNAGFKGFERAVADVDEDTMLDDFCEGVQDQCERLDD